MSSQRKIRIVKSVEEWVEPDESVEIVESDESVKSKNMKKSDIPIDNDAEEALGKSISDANFRLANKYILLTYKTHIDKVKYLEFFNGKFKGNVEWIRLAHETGDKTNPYNHTHVVASAKKIFSTRNARFLDYENLHPHIMTLKTKKAFADAKIYIAKEDNENADLKEYEPSLVQGIMSCATDMEALEKYCQKPNDAAGILTLRGMKTYDFRTEKVIVKPKHPWQFALLDMLKEKANRRDVIWILDKVGNTGKSELGDYIEDTCDGAWTMINKVNRMADLAEIILGELSKGWKCEGIMFDLTASAEHNSGFYDGIECIKNGRLTSTKWKGAKIRFDIPHVVVFANFLPKIDAMKMDRWKIFEIRDFTLHSIDAYKVYRNRHFFDSDETDSESWATYGCTLGSVISGTPVNSETE